MGYRRSNLEDEWEGLEPEQPKERNWVLWLAIAAVILMLAGICLLGGYLLLQQFQRRTEPSPPLQLPTSPAATPTREGVAPPETPSPAATPTLEETVVSTPLPLAPTATLAVETPTDVPAAGPDAVQAPRVPVAPVIDGDLSEWGGTDKWESAFRVFQATSWDGTEDLTAFWQLAWDANNLYVAVEVIDDLHVQTQTGNQIFRGDSVDMQFDVDRPGDYGDGVNQDDIQITLSPGDFGGLAPSAFRYQGNSSGQIVDAPGGNQVLVAAVPTAAGYTLEAAIPWSDLLLAPTPGLVMGLALNANDNDTPGAGAQEVMVSHVATRTLTDPTSWGTLTLNP